jgi:hypothetical protein
MSGEPLILFDTALEVDAVEAAALHRLLHVLLEQPPEINSIKYQQCCGSMTFWCGSGAGSADPCI